MKRYPEKLEDLLEDRRYLSVQRYLRKIYADPLTGKPEWSLIAAPGGGIMGIHSLSEAAPIRRADGAKKLADWRFVYEPPAGAQAPAAKPIPPAR